ncbi:MAG: AAA family ATPase, partial [Candidatus Bathyarchaeia archaeon]
MSSDRKDMVFDIFDRVLSRYPIFRNRDALRPEYVPDNLPHRDEQIQRLAFILAPSLKGSLPSNVFLYGKPGTGKTAVTHFVLNRLRIKAKETESSIAISYVNCRIAGTEYRVLSSLCSSIGVDVPFTGLSKAEVFQRFKNGLEKFGGILIV